MRIRLKDDSINLDGLVLPIVWAIYKAGLQWQHEGHESITITSARDGQHMDGSLHYDGAAVDLRIWGIADPTATADRLRRDLPREFDVILEADHLHLEFDPAR